MYIFCFHCSSHLNIGISKRTSADDLLFAGTSLSKPIEIIFKDQFINNLITLASLLACQLVYQLHNNVFVLGDYLPSASFLVPSYVISLKYQYYLQYWSLFSLGNLYREVHCEIPHCHNRFTNCSCLFLYLEIELKMCFWILGFLVPVEPPARHNIHTI